jgi:phage terminase Nu1 subunit (DNA packaging protein)
VSTPPAALGVSLDKLAEFFVLSPRRIRQLLDDGHVVRAADGKNFEFLPSVKAYIAYLQQAAQGKAVSDDGKEKQRAQTDLLKIQRDKAQMDYDIKRGALITGDEHRAVSVKLVTILSEGANSLPDLIERKTGVTGAVVDAVSKVCDQWRMNLYEQAVTMLGGTAEQDIELPTTTDRSADTAVPIELDPVVDEPPQKKRGRPRKIKADGFTPDLI